MLGYDPENVIDLRDATQAQMWSTFGNRATAERSDLWSYLDPEGCSDVVVFYPGHGAPGIEDKRGYLLPVNADSNTAELNGYPIDVLYENLSNLEEARSAVVYLDACFSGGSGDGGMLIADASPVYVEASLPQASGSRLTVLTAATGKQLASWDRKSGHGLFTHHLLDALYVKGDAVGERAELAAIEAKAHRRLRQLPKAVAAYRSWLRLAPADHPERRRMLLELQKAERGEVGPTGGEVFRDCDGTWCPEMVVVPAGSFMMGSPSGEKGRDNDEGPVHNVTIGEAFAVGVTEVTFDEWDACRRSGGCSHTPDGEGWGRGRRPVIDVSWQDAQDYVRWLSKETGEEYRLASESEWEYVARAGTTEPFHFGSTISTAQANYDGTYTYGAGRKGRYRKRTEPVGSFPANAYGVHDVHGNASEWVEDCWHVHYRAAPANGSAWTRGGDSERRVLRGGSWRHEPENLRSANRHGIQSSLRTEVVGFRVAKSLD